MIDPELKKVHEEMGKLKNVATLAYVVITDLSRLAYGDKRRSWPTKAREVLDTLDIWGCHP